MKGKIAVLAPGDVSPTQALTLLQSALALHGYALVAKPGATWIVSDEEIADVDTVVRVVALSYALAGEVALTFSSGPRPASHHPHYPTDSVVLSGRAAAVERLMGVIRGR